MKPSYLPLKLPLVFGLAAFFVSACSNAPQSVNANPMCLLACENITQISSEPAVLEVHQSVDLPRKGEPVK